LFLLAWSAQAALDQGRWDEAADQADEVLAHPGALNITRITALAVLGRLRARRGDPDPWSPLDGALELAMPAGELRRLVPVIAARAETAWLAGADDVAAETDLAWSSVCAHGSAWDVGELAFWRWRAGIDVDLSPIGSGTPFADQMAGDPVRAAALWEARECRYDRALALIDSDDHEQVRAALAELEALGARPATTLAARRLRELGASSVPRGPRLATRANPAGLTRRETEVIELITEGLRNTEIAQRLVLSERTVDHHVAAILRKLGVHDRAEASVEARRLGLSGPR
jgi:DNA-binding CsgD family transcriptional regulator